MLRCDMPSNSKSQRSNFIHLHPRSQRAATDQHNVAFPVGSTQEFRIRHDDKCIYPPFAILLSSATMHQERWWRRRVPATLSQPLLGLDESISHSFAVWTGSSKSNRNGLLLQCTPKTIGTNIMSVPTIRDFNRRAVKPQANGGKV